MVEGVPTDEVYALTNPNPGEARRGGERMSTTLPGSLATLSPSSGIWERVFTLNPLVIVGTRDLGRVADLAPKHLALPMSWEDYFGFVCTPRHRTYQNILRTRVFTVSYPKPTQLILASLSAAPRCDDGTKAELA